jgi:hypothetical protein
MMTTIGPTADGVPPPANIDEVSKLGRLQALVVRELVRSFLHKATVSYRKLSVPQLRWQLWREFEMSAMLRLCLGVVATC